MTATEVLVLAAKFVALVLLTLSATWLLIEDRALRRPRTWLARGCQRRQWPEVAFFIECPFCMAPWVCEALLLILWFGWGVSFPLIHLWPWAVRIATAPLHMALDDWKHRVEAARRAGRR